MQIGSKSCLVRKTGVPGCTLQGVFSNWGPRKNRALQRKCTLFWGRAEAEVALSI